LLKEFQQLVHNSQQLNQNNYNMKKMMKFAGVAALALALSQTLQATTISGNIGFTGGAVLNGSSAANATGVTSWISPVVNLVSGSFATIPTTPSPTVPVTFAAPWSFNSGASPFWTVTYGGETFIFNLLASSITAQGGTPGVSGFVIVNGTGTVSGSGNITYAPTAMSWSFTSQDPAVTHGPETFTFSASASAIPDGASTAMLLGLALSSVALLKRKFMA